MSVHKTKDGRWFAVYWEDGKQRRKYFGRGDLARHQARIFDDEHRKKRRLKETFGPSVAEICQAYHSQHPVEASTADSDFYRFTRLLVPRLGAIPVSSLSSRDLNEYVQGRLAEGKKRRTIQRDLQLLRAALNWAKAQRPPLIINNPMDGYRLPRGTDAVTPDPPTPEDVARLAAQAAPHLRRAILIRFYAGMRAGGEVLRLRWQDVQLGTGRLHVVSARKGGPVTRSIPIHDQLARLLADWKAEDARTIEESGLDIHPDQLHVVHYRLRPIRSMKRAWATAKRKAGITRRLRQTDVRHAFVTLAIEAGADIKAISEIIGHSRPDTTMRVYQHVLSRQHRDAIGKVPALPLVNVSGQYCPGSDKINE